jgi:hypothetical protein
VRPGDKRREASEHGGISGLARKKTCHARLSRIPPG